MMLQTGVPGQAMFQMGIVVRKLVTGTSNQHTITLDDDITAMGLLHHVAPGKQNPEDFVSTSFGVFLRHSRSL